MKLDIVVSDPKHPLLGPIRAWAKDRRGGQGGHRIRIFQRLAQAKGGDALALVACHEIAKPELRARYQRAYVTHASDLPQGRGWSPVVWTVLNGGAELTLSLIEAADPVDSGRVYGKYRARLKPSDLWPDIQDKLAKLVLRALDFALKGSGRAPKAQSGKPSFYKRRRPEDSRLDPNASLASQFDLLRVCDPERFPAYFDLRGERYEITLRKAPKRTSARAGR